MRKSSDGQKEPPENQKKLSWSQKAYDWNRDGKLSTLEWSPWYWNMYGEEEERRKQERIDYLGCCSNRRIKAKLKSLPPALHGQQALSAA